MKAFFEILKQDYKAEGFSLGEWVVYGVVAPLVLILLCGLCHG